MDPERAALFTEVPIDTANGLSGLAVDGDGVLWAVAERDAKAYAITLDAAKQPSRIQALPIENIPAGHDLESIGWLGTGRWVFGTEGREAGLATVLYADERDGTLFVTGEIKITQDQVGLSLPKNRGVEGLCGAGTTIVAAIEQVGEVGDRRWAPIVTIVQGHERNTVTRVHKLWLTSKTGKLSALDCQRAADGGIHVLAIERHYEVTRVLAFALPATAGAEITPSIALDLDRVLDGKLNLEGIAWLPDGSVVAVVDNQYRTITGPNELVLFKPGAVK